MPKPHHCLGPAFMEDLQSEYEKLSLVIGGINAGLWDWKIAAGQEWWSPRLYELLGLAEGEIKPSFDLVMGLLVHPDDRWIVEQALQDHFQTGKLFRLEFRLRHKSGEYRWFEASGKASFDAAGQPRRMCGSIIDINENKSLRLELEKTEYFLQEIGIMTQTGGWETDLNTRQTRWSKELLDLVAVPADFRPTTEKILDFFAPESVMVIRQKVKEVLGSGQAWDEELKIITAAKQEIWVRSIGKAVLDDSGAVTGLRGVLQNIHEQKLARQLLQASEEKFRKMFELSPVGMTLTDLETGMILEYNQAFQESTGYSADELKSITIQQLTPEEYMPAIHRQVAALFQEGVYGSFQIEQVRKDGSRFPVLLNGLLVTGDQGRPMVWSFRQDISEIKKRKQMISKLNEDLQALNEQKDRLFSVISHDLRGLVGNTDLLLDFLVNAAGGSPADIQELIRKARQSSAVTKALLEDLLLWARNQMNKIGFNPASLTLQPVIAQVLEALHAQSALKQLQLVSKVPGGISVRADQEMLKAILRNLVSNAIKFSYPKGTITVMADLTGEMVVVSVRDEGVGIAPENQEKLFDSNHNLTTRGTEGEKGSGLGLAICQDFVSRHGGKIMVESQLNKGSTFSFTLPKAPK
jgi:PAS domain S-box-containing protein